MDEVVVDDWRYNNCRVDGSERSSIWGSRNIRGADWLDHHATSLGTVSKADIDSVGGVVWSDQRKYRNRVIRTDLFGSGGRRDVEQNVQ